MLPEHRPLLFWGTQPHRLIAYAPGTRMVVMTLPLPMVLRFSLPVRLHEPLLQGKPVVGPPEPVANLLFNRWLNDPADSEHSRIFELELHAWLRRLVPSEPLDPTLNLPAQVAHRGSSAGVRRAAELAQALAGRSGDLDLNLAELARMSNLHPNYAATLFRETFGLSMGTFLTQCRVAHAQRLLLVTDLPMLDVATESGFGSVSRFYTAFRTSTGQSPRQYRQVVRGNS
ncbi:helix-turn-helix domain-containing protein [Deinococcus altitudinis]|uniref:helix-turn-helix domain-containing protein n=1 Tax=Deinococcus altitudinis TaxID=468914 RepID=UPI003891CE98